LREITEHLRGGHLLRDGPAWAVHVSSTFRYGLGWPLFLCGVAGLAVYAWRERRRGLMAVSFPAAYFLVIGSGDTAFARYMLPVVPFVAIFAAHLVVDVARRLAEHSLPRRPAAVIWTFAALVALPAIAADLQIDRLLSTTDSRLLAVRPVMAALPCGGTIYQTGFPYGHVQLPAASRRAVFTPVTFDEETREFRREQHVVPRPDLIVVQESPLAYSRVPAAIGPMLAQDYELIGRVDAIDMLTARPAYDEEDAFFVPLARFAGVVRPGPNFHVYRSSQLAASPCRR
jgi:hypothetical protein